MSKKQAGRSFRRYDLFTLCHSGHSQSEDIALLSHWCICTTLAVLMHHVISLCNKKYVAGQDWADDPQHQAVDFWSAPQKDATGSSHRPAHHIIWQGCKYVRCTHVHWRIFQIGEEFPGSVRCIPKGRENMSLTRYLSILHRDIFSILWTTFWNLCFTHATNIFWTDEMSIWNSNRPCNIMFL